MKNLFLSLLVLTGAFAAKASPEMAPSADADLQRQIDEVKALKEDLSVHDFDLNQDGRPDVKVIFTYDNTTHYREPYFLAQPIGADLFTAYAANDKMNYAWTQKGEAGLQRRFENEYSDFDNILYTPPEVFRSYTIGTVYVMRHYGNGGPVEVFQENLLPFLKYWRTFVMNQKK